MSDALRVHFCSNDESGHPSGYLFAVQIDDVDEAADPQACVSFSIGETGLKFLWLTSRGSGARTGFTLVDHRQPEAVLIAYPCHGAKQWVGNILWDTAMVPLASVRALLTWLLAHGYDLDEWHTAGPLADLLPSCLRAKDDEPTPVITDPL